MSFLKESEKEFIGKLATDHPEVMIKFGADMFRKGLIQGAIISAAGATSLTVITAIYKELKQK